MPGIATRVRCCDAVVGVASCEVLLCCRGGSFVWGALVLSWGSLRVRCSGCVVGVAPCEVLWFYWRRCSLCSALVPFLTLREIGAPILLYVVCGTPCDVFWCWCARRSVLGRDVVVVVAPYVVLWWRCERYSALGLWGCCGGRSVRGAMMLMWLSVRIWCNDAVVGSALC